MPVGSLDTALLAALLPVLGILLDLAIVFYFVKDLYRPERRVYLFDKPVWALIIVFGSVFGCAAYLLFGRAD